MAVLASLYTNPRSAIAGRVLARSTKATNPLSWLFAGLIGNERVRDGAPWGMSVLIQGFNLYAVMEVEPIGLRLAVVPEPQGRVARRCSRCRRKRLHWRLCRSQ